MIKTKKTIHLYDPSKYPNSVHWKKRVMLCGRKLRRIHKTQLDSMFDTPKALLATPIKKDEHLCKACQSTKAYPMLMLAALE